MKINLPVSVKQYFWGDNLEDLKWPDHQKYVAQTLLDKGSLDSIKWLFGKINKNGIKKMLPTLKLSKKSRNFWQTYLS